MKITVFPLALSASVLILTAGLGLADSTGNPPSATATGACAPGKAGTANPLLLHASTNARHANVSRVRYTATHAMPPARTVTTAGQVATCAASATTGATSLN